MKENKKEKNLRSIFGIFFSILLVTFLTLYLSQATGYYEYTAHKKVVFTNEQIKQFEQDIQDGKDVRMEDYLKNMEKDYSNKISKLGYHLSNTISDYVRDLLEATFKKLNTWMEEK